MTISRRAESLFIYGYFGCQNTGCDALLYGLLLRYTKDGRHRIYRILAKKPSVIADIQVGRVEWVGYNILAILKAISRSERFIVGGGTEPNDYGKPLRVIFILARLLALELFAKIAGKKIELNAVGIVTVKWWSRLFAAPILWMADIIKVRNSRSFSIAKGICKKDKVCQVADLVDELLPFVDDTAKDDDVIGIVPCLMEGVYNSNGKEDEEMALRVCLGVNVMLGQRPNLKVKLFVFNGESKFSDKPLVKKYWGLLYPRERVSVIDYNPDPVETFREIASCGRLIGMKYHACHFANLLEIPTQVISSHPKCRDLKSVEIIRLPELSGATGSTIRALIYKLVNRIPFPHSIYGLLKSNIVGCRNALDVGCGEASLLFRLGINNVRVTGLDIWEPYSRNLFATMYDSFIVRDIRSTELEPKSFDLVLLTCVIEHLPKHDAISGVIGKAETAARKRVIIVVPLGDVGNIPVDSNPYQHHLSIWQEKEIRDLGYKISIFYQLRCRRPNNITSLEFVKTVFAVKEMI